MKRFAHRGASALAPENTLAAFQKAVDLGCEWIETDLRLTSDGFPVLIHDETLERTTSGAGRVGDITLGRLLALDAGGWFSRNFRGERVPSLEEALQWGRHRCSFNLEIKEEERIDQLVSHLGRRFRKHQALDGILFSSFHAGALRRIRAAIPSARLGWLASKHTRGLSALNRAVGLAALHPKERLVTRRLIRRCHRLGLATHVWVVNRPRRIREMEQLGVDGVMTDDPRLFDP